MTDQPGRGEHSHPIIEPLGRLAFDFELLDLYLSFWTGRLIGDDQRVGQIVTAHASFGMVDMFCSLFRHRVELRSDDQERAEREMKELDAVRTRLHQVEEERNQLMHSVYSAPEEDGSFKRVKYAARARTGWRGPFHDVSVEDVTGLVERMRESRQDLGALMQSAFGEPDPSDGDEKASGAASGTEVRRPSGGKT